MSRVRVPLVQARLNSQVTVSGSLGVDRLLEAKLYMI
jgi:hypothetical protein